MPRTYDMSLVKALREGERNVTYKGVPITVRPIPEGGAPGDMDPRVYKSMKLMPILSHFMPKTDPDAPIEKTVATYRKMFADYKGTVVVDKGVNVREVHVASSDGYEVPARVYTREDAPAGATRPLLVFYHGGGFFGGGPHIVEQMCELLVTKLDCAIVSVDYRLCPENHYPQPLDDCWAVTRWAYEHAAELGADASKFAVAGDSAGGNLAAAITLRDRDEQTGMVGLQALLYPVVNVPGEPVGHYQGVDVSKYRVGKRHRRVLNSVLNMMCSMMGSESKLLDKVYTQGKVDPKTIYVSPLFDDFHDLPKTLLIFGEHDMLVFEDFAYARSLVDAGVDLTTIVYEGIVHGFADQIGVMPQAEDVIDEIAEQMRATFGIDA